MQVYGFKNFCEFTKQVFNIIFGVLIFCRSLMPPHFFLNILLICKMVVHIHLPAYPYAPAGSARYFHPDKIKTPISAASAWILYLSCTASMDTSVRLRFRIINRYRTVQVPVYALTSPLPSEGAESFIQYGNSIVLKPDGFMLFLRQLLLFINTYSCGLI